jgi:hypothetical protein
LKKTMLNWRKRLALPRWGALCTRTRRFRDSAANGNGS